jgi:hypothetical protein
MGSIDADAPNGEASRTTRPIAAAPETRTGMSKEIPARAARPPSRCRYRAPSPSRPAAQERNNAVSRVYTLDGREHHPIHRAGNRYVLVVRRVPVRRASPRPPAASAPRTPSTDTNLSFPPFLLPGVVLRSISFPFSFPGCADARTCDEKGERPYMMGAGAAADLEARPPSVPAPPSACSMLAGCAMRWRRVGVGGIGSLQERRISNGETKKGRGT